MLSHNCSKIEKIIELTVCSQDTTMLNHSVGNWSLIMPIGKQLKMHASRMEASQTYVSYF